LALGSFSLGPAAENAKAAPHEEGRRRRAGLPEGVQRITTCSTVKDEGEDTLAA
jgi:hypothetical protein